MKLLLIGATESWSIETFYLKYFRLMEDLEVDVFSTSEFHKVHYRWLTDRLAIRIFPNQNSYYSKLNAYVLEYIKQKTPDIIIVFKGMEIYPETLKSIKSLGVKISNYNPDHPFIIYSRGSGNKNVSTSVPLFDLHFCYSQSVVNRIESELGIKSVFLPFGYELPASDFDRIDSSTEIIRCCFIGNPDRIRMEAIQYLLQQKIEIDLYGHDWHKHLNPAQLDGLRIYDAIYGFQFWETARRYRVQINIFRPHNIGSHNMRTFEIPAVGGIMLAPDSPEHRMFFEDGSEVFLYDSLESMASKAKMILELKALHAQKIREAARRRSLNGKYDYISRAAFVYSTLKELIQ